MERLKFKIHPTFIIFACILIYFGKAVLFYNYILVMLIHELSHAFVARKLGYNIKNIKIIPFGICLNIKSLDLLPKDEIKIAIAGPLVNFMLALLSTAVWWIIPASYNFTYLFCYANFITAVFNLVPAFPLDGGRILLAVLKQNYTFKSAVKISKITNIVISILLFGLFIFSCFVEINLTYLFVIFCVLSGIFDSNKAEKYSFINYSNIKKIGKIVKIKSILVNENEQLYKVCKYIDNFSYLKIFIIDENKNIWATLNENQFSKIIENFASTQTFKTALKTYIKLT